MYVEKKSKIIIVNSTFKKKTQEISHETTLNMIVDLLKKELPV